MPLGGSAAGAKEPLSAAPNIMGVTLAMSKEEARQTLAARGFQRVTRTGYADDGRSDRFAGNNGIEEQITITYYREKIVGRIDLEFSFDRSAPPTSAISDFYAKLTGTYGKPTKCDNPDIDKPIRNNCQWSMEWDGRNERIWWQSNYPSPNISLTLDVPGRNFGEL